MTIFWRPSYMKILFNSQFNSTPILQKKNLNWTLSSHPVYMLFFNVVYGLARVSGGLNPDAYTCICIPTTTTTMHKYGNMQTRTNFLWMKFHVFLACFAFPCLALNDRFCMSIIIIITTTTPSTTVVTGWNVAILLLLLLFCSMKISYKLATNRI